MSQVTRIRVEALFIDGCPHHRPTLALVREVAAELGVAVDISEIEVREADEAERLQFLGSPTVRVEGNDIEPERRGDTRFAMSCRIYGTEGVPSRELIARALVPDRRL